MFWNELITAVAPFAFLLPFVILIELAAARQSYTLRSRFPGVVFFLLTPALAVLVSWPLHLAWASIGVPPLVNLAGLPYVVTCAIMFVFLDFLRYWEHRFEHRFMWRVHAIHHSPTDLHAANAYAHPLIGASEVLFLSIPLSLVATGGPTFPVLLGLFVSLQNFLIHSPIRLHGGKLRLFWVDCRFHRIHHSVEERHWHKNFGLCFTVWDRLFGTVHEAGDEEWPDTGVPGFPPPRTVRHYLLQSFRPRS